MPIKTILYVSRAHGHKLGQLRTLVPAARLKNERLGVTGILVFDGRHFMQVLEGPSKQIDTLMAQILLDDRHTCIRVLLEQRDLERYYPTCPLAYHYDDSRRESLQALVTGKASMSELQLRALFPVSTAAPAPVDRVRFTP